MRGPVIKLAKMAPDQLTGFLVKTFSDLSPEGAENLDENVHAAEIKKQATAVFSQNPTNANSQKIWAAVILVSQFQNAATPIKSPCVERLHTSPAFLQALTKVREGKKEIRVEEAPVYSEPFKMYA